MEKFETPEEALTFIREKMAAGKYKEFTYCEDCLATVGETGECLCLIQEASVDDHGIPVPSVMNVLMERYAPKGEGCGRTDRKCCGGGCGRG